MPAQKGTPRRTRAASQRETTNPTQEATVEASEDVKALCSPSKRGRRPAVANPKSPHPEEPMQSPKGKRRKVNGEDKQEEIKTPRRRTRSNAEHETTQSDPTSAATPSAAAVSTPSDETEKQTRGRIRKTSTLIEADVQVEPPSIGRSARNRQPSRRMMESKMDEELLNETLGTARRRGTSVVVVKREEPDESEAVPDDEVTVEKVVPPKRSRKSKQQNATVIPREPEEPSTTSVEPTRTVVFKTVSTPQVPPEASKETSERKRTISSSSSGAHPKPIVPVKSDGTKSFHASLPIRQSSASTAKAVDVNKDSNQASKTLLAEHRPGWDLPEEHRPKGAARAVVVNSAGEVVSDQEQAVKFVSHPSTSDKKPVMEEIVEDEEIEATTYEVIEDGQHVVYEEIVHAEEIGYSEGVEPTEQEMADDDPAVEVDIDVDTAPEMEMNVKQEQNSAEDDDDAPPQLVPELGPTHGEPLHRQETYIESGDTNMIRITTPGGTPQYVQLARGEDGTEIYVDENGEEIHMLDEDTQDLRDVEFNFLDSKNICCGLCGEIVPYDTLMSHHLPNHHPEVMGQDVNADESYDLVWLRDKLFVDKKSMEGGFRYDQAITNEEMLNLRMRGARPLRKVSQIRVNPVEMPLPQLEGCLRKKMIEKMGRKVPVSLVDKQHAKCGICNAVVSLNKKFEIVHLVRHFNAWHPSAHRCAGSWQNRPIQPGCGKPLSIQDFAVIDVNMDSPDNLQCIWCGMFMDRNALAMHFTEVHPEDIEVPKCLLCLQELVINARLLEKYGEDFEVVLPDEFHVKCQKFEQTYSSETALDRAIAKRMQKMQASSVNDANDNNEDDDDGDDPEARDSNVTNSRMTFGRRNKPKRSFVQPSLRQAVPANSKYVEAVTECHWKCRLCNGNIFGAVISAGAIKHYKQYHPGEMESMQYELCKARLERVSDGCMEFVHPQLVECLICNLTYALHKPYNMCRGIRHLKIKHPEMMPEYNGSQEGSKKGQFRRVKQETDVQMGEVIDDPEMVERFKNEYNIDFEKVQTLYQDGAEPVYVLLAENETLDAETARELARSLDDGDGTQADKKNIQRQPVAAGEFDEDDPYGELAEDDEMADIETKATERRRARPRVIRAGGQVVSSAIDDGTYMPINQEKDQQAIEEEEQAAMDDGAVYTEEEVGEQQYEYYEANEPVYIEEREGEYMEEAPMEEDFMEGDEVVYEDQVDQ